MAHQHDRQSSSRISIVKIALFVFLAVIVFLLITEHWAHILGIPPLFLLLGLCILMHLFMHGGHGGHGGGNGNSSGGSNIYRP
ncbi:MAG: hypothetical protein CLLPBCKN_007491 [Chroococcidiopsis cubana SAG 39.79]|uniref:DUF2933 domain-containing protein n=1 Tax=Chroococcidiopsis cubana TaxID=171392 RepID=UPI000D07CF39|nr:DUF2933 domain-containing protein [Chroococcidiopsis cubana]MDZ4878056.1 hypothetical protein [Chroococcidiopsis cubana SAG 39.79]PSB66519.1 hypothetical protein C7B79_00760 [Chroococcidiopsis cubana CCALA 043]